MERKLKNLTILLLILSLISIHLTLSHAEEPSLDTLRAADVNTDAVIDVLDLILVAKHFGAPLTAEQSLAADVNDDGRIDVLDLTLIARHFGTTLRASVTFAGANPAVGSELAINGTITLTFDSTPENFTVNIGTAIVNNRSVTITGPFDPGDLRLTIAWADGSETLTYRVFTPDTDPPHIINTTLTDGDMDVDPEAINNSGSLHVEFHEPVRGDITLQSSTGADIGWIGTVEGNQGSLKIVAGKEIDHGATYVIAGRVSDSAGNTTDIRIAFTTANRSSGIPIEVTDATFETLVLGSDLPIVVEFKNDT